MTIIQKNNESKKTAKCKIQYPEIEKEKISSYELQYLSEKHCGMALSPLWESSGYSDCIKQIEGCYEITRQVE